MATRILVFLYQVASGIHPLPSRGQLFRDLHEMRDKRPDEDEWIAMVLSLIAATLVLAPKRVGVSKTPIRQVVNGCRETVQSFLVRPAPHPTVNRCE